jgi:peroxiredoxin
VKILGVGVGDEDKQINAYKKQLRVSFPLLSDKEGKVFQAWKLQGVPYMLVVNKEGKVLMSHGGAMKDFDETLKEIREIHKQQ